MECEQLKDDLGIKECTNDNDYWVGAIKACGGGDKLPSANQLAELAKYLYDTSSIKVSSTTFNIYLNTEKASSLGLYIGDDETDYNFTLWSGVEDYGGYGGFGVARSFNMYSTSIVSPKRTYGGQQVVCVEPTSSTPSSDDDALDTYVKVLCDKAIKHYNIADSDCSVTPESVQSSVSSNSLADLTPNIVFSNGLMIYIGSDLEDISDLSDAENADDREGFVVYVDVNGKSGSGKLWEDVFPFYLLKSGKVLPAYDADLIVGANNKEYLNVNVLYDSYNDENREIKLLLKDSNYRNAACATGYIKSAKYCDGKTQYDLCKKDYHDCRMIVKEPVKLF